MGEGRALKVLKTFCGTSDENSCDGITARAKGERVKGLIRIDIFTIAHSVVEAGGIGDVQVSGKVEGRNNSGQLSFIDASTPRKTNVRADEAVKRLPASHGAGWPSLLQSSCARRGSD